jgi:hypothetical protein
MDYSAGSRVRVKLYSGDIVAAEIVVIFTCGSPKLWPTVKSMT